MDFALPADDDPRRLEVRSWLASNPSPSRRDLAEGGFIPTFRPLLGGFAFLHYRMDNNKNYNQNHFYF